MRNTGSSYSISNSSVESSNLLVNPCNLIAIPEQASQGLVSEHRSSIELFTAKRPSPLSLNPWTQISVDRPHEPWHRRECLTTSYCCVNCPGLQYLQRQYLGYHQIPFHSKGLRHKDLKMAIIMQTKLKHRTRRRVTYSTVASQMRRFMYRVGDRRIQSAFYCCSGACSKQLRPSCRYISLATDGIVGWRSNCR
jgi:hypothetical protein